MVYSRSGCSTSSTCGDQQGGSGGLFSRARWNLNGNFLDHDVAQLIKLRSEPNESFSRIIPGGHSPSSKLEQRVLVSTVQMLAGREANYSRQGKFSSADCCHVLSRFLPVSRPSRVDKRSSRAYVSQFSNDGSLFIAAFQEGRIRIYNVEKGWKVQKDILAKSMGWTITDTCFSPDQRLLVYGSMSTLAHIVNVGSSITESDANVTEIHEACDFSGDAHGGDDFSIFSVKFSKDGRELVAGASDYTLHIYDLERNQSTIGIHAHQDDVNTVCFADETGHIIYSGGDDTFCKVWDRRCFISRGRATGCLSGHLEGVSFIDSRGDGRYFISNGKDQTTKLWDVRKMSSSPTETPFIRDPGWDYRWMEYPASAKMLKHPNDMSLATYSGHSVLHTLIRCYFSPEYSTGQKYIYTGSSDGSVYIYDLVSGAEVARLGYHEEPVRDCNWHPHYPMIVSSSWDGIIAKWEFPGSGEAKAPVPVPTPAPVLRRSSRRTQTVAQLDMT